MGNVPLVPVCQQMLCQHFPEIVIDAVQIGSEITGNVTVPVVQMQQALKVFFALGAQQRYRQGGVPQFHIKKANTCDLKCGVIQINYIAWTVGRGKRIMGRKVRRAGELRDGIPLAGDRMAGQVGDLRLLLGLGEDGVGLVNDLPMEAVAETGHIKVQPHKIRVPNGLRRPCHRRVSLYHSGVPVGILAGVLIRPVRKYKFFENGLVLLVDFPDSGRGFLFRDRGAFRIGEEHIPLYQLCNPTLYLGPGEVLVLPRVRELDGESGQLSAVLCAEPRGGVLIAGVPGFMLHGEIGDGAPLPVRADAGDRHIMAVPELLHILVQLMAGDAAHGHAAQIGQIALGEHQVQLMGGHPRIRPEHLIEVPQLVQHDVAGVGLFHNFIALPEAHAGRHGRGSRRGLPRLGHRKSRGRVRALCFLDGLHLLPLGGNDRGHETQL